MSRSNYLTACGLLASVFAYSGVASAQPAPPAAGPAGADAPPPVAAPVTPPPGAATPAAPPAPAAPTTTDDDDTAMTFHASRPTDMQQFAEDSFKEISIGKAKPRFALNLFGDMSVGAASRSEGVTRPDPAFAVGIFDMLFNAELDGKLKGTAEVTFQYEPNNPLAELERLHIRWTPNKYFWLEAGRYHTDIGYWNMAYHHGRWLQLSIERPRTIALHGGIVAMHAIGAQGGVILPVAKGSINVTGNIGSQRDPLGSGNHQQHGAAFSPINGGHVKVEAVGLGLTDLRFGVAGMYDRIAEELAVVRPGLPNQGIDEYVANAFVAYPSVPFMLIAEAYQIQHHIPKGDLSSGQAGAKWRTYGAFAMMGYTLGRVTPYVRGEYVTNERNTLLTNPFYIPEPKALGGPTVALDLLEGTLGTRIDVSTWSALKLEYRITTGQGLRRDDLPKPAIHTTTINWSFGI